MLFLLLAFGIGYALTHKKKAASALAHLLPAASWPEQSTPALAVGKHYFFAFPISGKWDTDHVAAALSLIGWQDVQVMSSLAKAPLPFPPGWAAAKAPVIRVVGRWQGNAGAPLNLAPLAPLGVSPMGARVWLPTEDYLSSQVRHF